ncbi:MAG: fluoride efflux transporter CrcB [Pseudomonadota bacterium]
MILAIAAGGAIGAIMRYAVYGASFSVFGGGFPIGTMIVNILGSFAMGILVALFETYWQPSQEVRLLLMTGVLGAFTTFSNFSMDAVLMFEKGDVVQPVVYVAGSVFLSIGGLFAGLMLVRQLAT